MVKKIKLTKEEAAHIAELVNLNISGEEEKYAEMLSETINYIEILNELDTDDVEETYQVTGLTNVFQINDQHNTTLTQDDSLSNASERVRDLFATEGVFDR